MAAVGSEGQRLRVGALAWAAALVMVGGMVLVQRGAVESEDPGGWSVETDLAAEIERTLRFYLPEYDLRQPTLDSLINLEGRWMEFHESRSRFVSYGREAGFWLPGIAVDTRLDFELDPEWPPGAADHRVQVTVNRVPVAALAAGRVQHHSVALPSATLGQGGLNLVAFSCTSCTRLAVASVRTSVAVSAEARQEKWFPRGSWAEAGRIVQVPGAHLSLALRPGAGARFVASLPPAWRTGAVDYSVVAETISGASTTLVRTRNSAWRASGLEVPLDAFRDQPVRLVLRVERETGSREPTAPAEWLSPRVLVPARRPPPAPAPASRRPNVVVYVVDALRADHLQPYGYERDVSPRIASFAEGAVVFEHAYAQSVWTKPSVGSLLTGLYPEEHLAVDDASALGADVRLASSYLEALGYTTAALQANGNAGPKYGFDRDFDSFVLLDQVGPRVVSWNTSARIHARLAELLPSLPEPFFVFVQSLDPHYPYGAEGEYLRYLEGPYRTRPLQEIFTKWTAADGGGREQQSMTRYLEARYDGAIRHNDLFFGKLLDVLAARGVLERTAVVLTADHGEAFRDHGWEMGHATLFEHTVRVPLITKPPGWRDRRRCSVPVQHVDLLPTILEWAGVAAPAALPGRSLSEALATGGAVAPRSLHISIHPDRQLGRFPHRSRAVVNWPYKLIHADVRLAAYGIYDLAADPAETHSLLDGYPPQGSVLLDFLLAEARRRPLSPGRTTRTIEVSQEELRHLKALGYLR